jgi:hypothetical protein
MTTQGNIADPFTLSDALQNGRIKSGHTLYLRGGTYIGDFVCTLVGVTIKPYQSEKPIINGSITLNGANTTVDKLEITSTAWITRQSAYSDDTPPDITVSDGITVAAANCTIKACYIHDCREGIYAGSNAPGLKIESCLLLNNGWYSTIRGSGHGLYLQNNDLLNPKIIKNTIIGPQYGYGLHIYGSSDAHLHGFTLHDNVHLWHGLVGGNSAVSGVSITDDLFFDSLQLGYNVTQNVDVTLQDCLIVAQDTYALNVLNWANAQLFNNIIAANANFIVDQSSVDVVAWQNNDYYHDSAYSEPFGMTWAAWQLSGRDTAGTFTTGVPNDSTIISPVLNNRAILTIQNWSNQVTVAIDLSSLGVGPFTLRNALNPNETLAMPIATANINMSSWTVAVPYADSVALTTWDTKHAVFIVEIG